MTYSLNTDYNPKGMSSQDLTALFMNWQGGAISYQTYYENIQRGEVGNVARTAQQERALIEREGTGMDDEI